MHPSDSKSWIQLVKTHDAEAEFGNPASESDLEAVEKALGINLPEPLRQILIEADGIEADYGSGLIWPAAKILERNHEFRASDGFRELYMPFNHLLFFGDDGGGNQFAFAIHADGKIHKRDVFQWQHESDERLWFSSSLEQFIEKRLKKEDDAEDKI